MVLGMDWLASLGNIEANFRNLVLKWGEQGEELRGDPALCKEKASWKAIFKALQDEGEGYYVAYQEETEKLNKMLDPFSRSFE